jgi:hypothetical protein
VSYLWWNNKNNNVEYTVGTKSVIITIKTHSILLLFFSQVLDMNFIYSYISLGRNEGEKEKSYTKISNLKNIYYLKIQ